MSKLITQIKRVALALCLATPIVSWAGFEMENPVTGEPENYTWKFTGTDTWNGTNYWENSNGNPPSGVPAKTSGNIWDPILFDGNTINIAASMSVEGWNLRLGLYNGANVRLNTFVKWQGDTTMWVTVDDTSKFTVGGFGKGNLSSGQVIKCSTTRENGIEWLVNLESNGTANNTFEYYLKGAGSISYQAVSAANHKIKMADVTLSGNDKSVRSKTLVSFTSSSKTFTADAAIKVKDGDNVLKTVYLTSVTADTTTLTTDDDVGACELVQTSTGIVLYYVDGDPSDMAVYKPSININFTNGSGLTTRDDVGLDGYAVPGTSWNNFIIPDNANEQTFNAVKSMDSTGTVSLAPGVSVKVSGHRGSYANHLDAASNPLYGYVDENHDNPTPIVTIAGIPYEHYRVIVYHSTDSEHLQFGYDTINGFDFTYVDGVRTTGTSSWGDTGGDWSAEPIEEGVNTLVSAVLSGDTVTMVAHRIGGQWYPTARGCFAAIQVVEYVPEVGENDLEIAVDGATEYEVTEAKELSGTVYLTGSGTLTLSGDYKITAATIDVGKDVVLNINADRLDATTFTGSGTVVYDDTAPVADKGWTNIEWSGTVWIKSQTVAAFEGNQFGNVNSTIRFTGVTGYLQTTTYNNIGYVHTVPLELVDDGNTAAFTYNNGWSGYLVKVNTLKGTGTLKTQENGLGEHIYIVDGSGFTGVFNLTGKYVYVGGSQPDNLSSTNPDGKLEIRSGVTMTVPSGKTWTANGGFVVNGTLNVNGTLASSHTTKAVSGAGTVVFGGVPSPTGDAWWKNAAWTGTVEIKGATTLNGDYAFNDYGNSASTLKLTNCSGWLKPNYTCVPALEIGGTFAWNDGSSGLNNTFKVGTLKGSGTISIPDQGAETAVWQITENWSGFTGAVVGNNSGARRVLVFGPTLPTSVTKGDIYISGGATLDLDNSSGAWWGVGMGFVVDGTVKASSRSKWGGGTYMTLGDTGVLELTSTSNINDSSFGESATSANFSNVTGTGTIKYSSTAGWRAFPSEDEKMPATTLTIQTELADSLILPTKTNDVTVVGNLAGTKNLRSDWSNNGPGGRILTVTQSKNTEWEGKFVSNRITQFNVVAPAEGTPGTLTMSGTNDIEIPMQVDGSVNLTGTWVGNTTVAGTFGGTGTITGNLTFSAGSTFKVYSTEDEDGLVVSGTVTCPAEGKVTVDVSALGDVEDDVVILTAGSVDANKFTLAAGTEEGYSLDVNDDGDLVLKVPSSASDTYDVVNEGATLDENGQFTVPAGTTTIKIGDCYLYTDQEYDGVLFENSDDGITVTVLPPAVVEGEEKKAIDVGAETVTLNVELVEGLYYGVAAGTDFEFTKPPMTQYTGDNGATILTVAKPVDPEDSTKKSATGFFKVFVDIKQ